MASRKNKKNRRKSKSSRKPHRDLTFSFSKNDQIGASDAETDRQVLEQCFVDTGDVDLLCDLSDHRRIILGRTGTGKSALLGELTSRKSDHAIEIAPDDLALTYVSNSTVLSYFASLGLNLDPFFKLLWRHVLAVEVLSHHFHDHVETSERRNRTIRQWLDDFVKGSSRKAKETQETVEYLKTWGSDFWQETEYRVKEITQRFEDELTGELKSSIGIDLASIEGGVVSSHTLSEEKKLEILEKAQHVVSKAQIEDLRKIIPLLDGLLNDRQKAYFLLIDGLDEEWVGEKLKYRLIKALIITLKEMSKVRNVKVVISLRRDLLERVFRRTRGAGFQEEKYESLYLPLHWTKADILEILDRRVKFLVHKKTGRQNVGFRHLMPNTVSKLDISEYIYSRAPRPRDVIALFNACIASSVGNQRINAKNFRVAEGEYSRSRLRALADEWIDSYPALPEFTAVISKLPSSFKISAIPSSKIENIALAVACEHVDKGGPLVQLATNILDEVMETDEGRRQIVKIFYKIGLVGLKTTAYEKESWVDSLGHGFPSAEIDDETSVVVHPAYYRALGIRYR